MIGICSRFASQKGFDLLEQIAGRLAERELAVVALETGEPYYEKFFRDFAYANAGRFAVQVRYDDALAHKVEAGLDIFLMPAGLSLRTRTRFTRSNMGRCRLCARQADSMTRSKNGMPSLNTGTGFKFDAYEAQALLDAD